MVQLCDNSDCSNAGTKTCSKCKQKNYCSVECQRKDWFAHKRDCQPRREFPRIAIIDIPGKGKGVVALERIPRGTLIVAEKPRIILPTEPAASKAAYQATLSRLSSDDITFILSFPYLGQAPARHIYDHINHRDRHFVPLGPGMCGLCETICRINHTCSSPKGGPNANYTWKETAEREELYAIKDIQANQEIEVSYISRSCATYKDPSTHLPELYGFHCRCPGCSRSPAERRASEQKIRAFNAFSKQLPKRVLLGPNRNPLAILTDIEAQILIICGEGFKDGAVQCAIDAFEICACYEDTASAREWYTLVRDYRALYRGRSSSDYIEAASIVEDPRQTEGWGAENRKMKLRGPSKRVVEAFDV
ncbi:SET domain-containing protein [Favolaschia claudopus]|uniref:SET domain-containing protein n=1 Tax=Favolaschia claudopus TaxID=2862362 RepID=A0AAW0DQL7_9AGAR